MSQWSLNQSRFSKTSVKLFVFGVPILGVQASKATESIGGELMYGNSPEAIGKVIGPIKSEFELGFIPEMIDTLKQTVGIGYAEIPLSIEVDLFEPYGGPIYTFSNGACWLTEDAFDAPAEGAVQTIKLVGRESTNWNGVTALDMMSRGTSPASVAAIFASLNLSL